MALPRITKRHGLAETAKLVTSQFNVTTPPGMVLEQGPTGASWRDDRWTPFLARIVLDDGSGSGSGSGEEIPPHHYGFQEVVPVVVDGVQTFAEKEHGRRGTASSRPAVEANRRTDVVEDTIAWLTASTGEPGWYWFLASCCEELSGSGNGVFTVHCGDGSTSQFVIDGNTVRQLN